ncbi:MAG: DNA topoisomerase [Lachnospiraceae bacterium]|nr:DNA topoisomerase [Lachnospiraceae bacterium]
MGKRLFISEKPSVAQDFARTLGVTGGRHDGYLETEDTIVTWCVGHLVTMSYPEAYDPSLKKWRLETIPFIPETFRYEVIPDVKKQFAIVSGLLARKDVETIYVCTDSGREGEYIYRLVEMMSDPCVKEKDRRRVWIDSFTDEEIKRGIREAKPESAYDHVSDAAYLRAKEDYLMGINFSRLLTLKYGDSIANYRGDKYTVLSCGRVMTCVLGMVVKREREIRSFVKQPFFRVLGNFGGVEAEWKVTKGSAYEGSPRLYKENGFQERMDAEALIASLKKMEPQEAVITSITRKTEKKNPPLLYNLAELQNDCSRLFKISPDQTLNIAQELYEKKLTTYPRTDARVLSSAVAKVIDTNLRGLTRYEPLAPYARLLLDKKGYVGIGRSRYTNDKAITDHYAIIPTGANMGAVNSLSPLSRNVYDAIVRRFLSVFFPAAEYQRTAITYQMGRESFFANQRRLMKPGYLRIAGMPKLSEADQMDLTGQRKGDHVPANGFAVKEGETVPPKRYTSGSMILAMENAGQLIEDESLREQIKGSGIGTSATRADILKKLVRIGYLNLNKKTQVISPEFLGEMVYDVVDHSIKALLDPRLTASWEKGLTGVAGGSISNEEYLEKLRGFIVRRCEAVKGTNNAWQMRALYDAAAPYYKTKASAASRGKTSQGKGRKKNGTSRTSENQ